MRISDVMTKAAVADRPDDSLAAAARKMWEQQTGSLLVVEEEQLVGIVTERDVLDSLGQGQSPDDERVHDHLSGDLTFASPDWSLERAAEVMIKSGFRHLVVVSGGEIVGVLSMRDIVRCWIEAGVTSNVAA